MRCRVCLILVALVVCGGAARADQPTTRPYLLHLPGISGESMVDHSFVRGLKAARLDAEIEIYDWTENDRGIPALQAYERNHKEAKLIAEKLAEHFKRGGPPIYLTCHSGGAGLAAWALEALPAEVKVKRLLFIAPALSPTYDLSKALSHVTDHAYSFWSSGDQAVLSAGTRVFGTIDGEYVDAAGFVGFEKPKDSAEPGEYKKLEQFPYNPDWSKYYNFGDHIGPMAAPFAMNVFAPLLGAGKAPATQPAAGVGAGATTKP